MARFLRYLGIALVLLCLIGGGVLYQASSIMPASAGRAPRRRATRKACSRPRSNRKDQGQRENLNQHSGGPSVPRHNHPQHPSFQTREGAWLRLDHARMVWTGKRPSARPVDRPQPRNRPSGSAAPADLTEREPATPHPVVRGFLGAEPADQGGDGRLHAGPARPRRGCDRRRGATRRPDFRQARPPVREPRPRVRSETANSPGAVQDRNLAYDPKSTPTR